MSEEPEKQPVADPDAERTGMADVAPQGAADDIEGQGGEGEGAENLSPPIGDDAVRGQTQVPAADDDVGVPPDEEMGREK